MPEPIRDRSEQIARWFEIPILVASALVIPVIVIEQSSWGAPWKTIGGALNWAIWAAFLAELMAMLVVTRDRWQWVRSHPLDVAIVVFTPPFLPASLQAFGYSVCFEWSGCSVSCRPSASSSRSTACATHSFSRA